MFAGVFVENVSFLWNTCLFGDLLLVLSGGRKEPKEQRMLTGRDEEREVHECPVM